MKEKLDELSPAMINLVIITPNICPVVTTSCYKFKKGKAKEKTVSVKKYIRTVYANFTIEKHKKLWKKKAKLENVNKILKLKP